MPSNHLIPCCPLFLLPSIFPSIRVFSNEQVHHIRWPKYWSFSFTISLKTQRCMGPKITASCAVRVNSGQKIQKDPQKKKKYPTANFEEPGAKPAGPEQNQGTVHAPYTERYLRGTLTLEHTPTPIPTLTYSYKEQASQGVSKPGTLLFVPTARCYSKGPNKVLPEFLVWPLVNFCILGRPRPPSVSIFTAALRMSHQFNPDSQEGDVDSHLQREESQGNLRQVLKPAQRVNRVREGNTKKSPGALQRLELDGRRKN